MIDQCKNCIVRGDLMKCEVTECSLHDSWYAKKLTFVRDKFREESWKNACRVQELEREVAELRELLNKKT